LRVGIRLLLDLVERTIEENAPLVSVDLPTGYGKSTASLELLWEIYSGNLDHYAERVVHVVPTRCLVEEFVERARQKGIPAYGQCMFFTPELKDPYFIPPIVFSTIDSYALNFCKIPVAEFESLALGRTLGHFDIPRYATFSAINIFDEYHLLVPNDAKSQDEKYFAKAWTTLMVIIKELLRVKAPVVLETATPRTDALNELKTYLGVIPRVLSYDAAIDQEYIDQGTKIIVNDKEFSDPLLNREYPLSIHATSDFCKKAIEICMKVAGTCNILIVCNTIAQAVSIYRDLRARGLSTILLHSQFTIQDREQKLRVLRDQLSKNYTIAICTQVIEVGVNLDFDFLITDAAPLASLIQRVGRIGRDVRREGEQFPIHLIYDVSYEQKDIKLYSNVYPLETTKQTIQLLADLKNQEKRISWRIPASRKLDKIVPYNLLAEEIYRNQEFYNQQVAGILNAILSPSTDPSYAMLQITRLHSLIRDSMIMPVYVTPDYSELKPNELIVLYAERLVPAKPYSLGLELHETGLKICNRDVVRKSLKLIDDKFLAAFEESEGEQICLLSVSAEELYECFSRCFLRKNGKRYLFRALIANENAYNSEEGLMTWL